MKRILSLTGILALVIFFTSAVSIDEMPQDPPKSKKHIKMVKIDDDGKKTEIDTVIEADKIFVWNGDTIEGEKNLGELLKGLEDLDIDFDFDFDMDVDEHGNMFVLKGEGKPMIYKFKTNDGDSIKQIRMKVIADGDCDDIDIMKWHDKADKDFTFRAPHSAHTPRVIRINKHKGNVIDLSDPGIISYEKKDLKDGKERIVIVREKPSDEEIEVHEEIIMHGAKSSPVFIHEGHPRKAKEIKVIAGDEGHVKILEDNEVWSIDKIEEGTKVIEKDGKKVIIKKIKEGGEMKIDVEVEEEIEEHEE